MVTVVGPLFALHLVPFRRTQKRRKNYIVVVSCYHLLTAAVLPDKTPNSQKTFRKFDSLPHLFCCYAKLGRSRSNVMSVRIRRSAGNNGLLAFCFSRPLSVIGTDTHETRTSY